jgi:hypothetical protein
MEWLSSLSLKKGDERRIETPWCTVSLRFRENEIHYERAALEFGAEEQFPVNPTEEATEPLEKTFIHDGVGKKCRANFLPIYPDRPFVFKIEDELEVPPDGNGFFCLTLDVGMGVTLTEPEYTFEEIRPAPKKNSYWGPPNDGVLSYESRSESHTDSAQLMKSTGFQTAVVPVYYRNRRDEEAGVDRCLIPLQELDLYQGEEGDLVFEVVELTHRDDFSQEPKPIKRPPKELKTEVKKLMDAPNAPQSLFERVRSLPKFDSLSSVFVDR